MWAQGERREAGSGELAGSGERKRGAGTKETLNPKSLLLLVLNLPVAVVGDDPSPEGLAVNGRRRARHAHGRVAAAVARAAAGGVSATAELEATAATAPSSVAAGTDRLKSGIVRSTRSIAIA